MAVEVVEDLSAYVIAGVDWLRSLALPGPDVGH